MTFSYHFSTFGLEMLILIFFILSPPQLTITAPVVRLARLCHRADQSASADQKRCTNSVRPVGGANYSFT